MATPLTFSRAVLDRFNGDGRYLVNPSQFSSVGIEDEEFFVSRGKADLRILFESIGHSFSDEVGNTQIYNI